MIQKKPKLHIFISLFTAFIYTYVTGLSTYYVFSRLHISGMMALALASLFAIAICIKEYAKIKTSSWTGHFEKNRFNAWVISFLNRLSWLIAIFCALGLEAIFFVSNMFAIDGLRDSTLDLKNTLILLNILFFAVNLPIDTVFYWNCIRKFLQLNNELSLSSHRRKKIRALLTVSTFFSSTYFFFRASSFLYMLLGNHYTMILCGFPLGLFSYLANSLLMKQTINEFLTASKAFSRPSSWIQRIMSSHQGSYFSLLISTCYAALFAIPCAQVLYANFAAANMPQLVVGMMVGGCGMVVMLAYTSVSYGYLIRYSCREH